MTKGYSSVQVKVREGASELAPAADWRSGGPSLTNVCVQLRAMIAGARRGPR